MRAVSQVLRDYGMNFVRLHQKTNPSRWYYEADRCYPAARPAHQN